MFKFGIIGSPKTTLTMFFSATELNSTRNSEGSIVPGKVMDLAKKRHGDMGLFPVG